MKDKVHYRVYGEYNSVDDDIYDSQGRGYTISLPLFRDLKAVTVENNEEVLFTSNEEALHIFNSYLTALQIKDDETYMPLYVRGELIRKVAARYRTPACFYNNFAVPLFLYLDGAMYPLYLCTDKNIFYRQDDTTLCYAWNKKKVSDGLVAATALAESQKNLETGEEKLIWEPRQGIRGKLLVDFTLKGIRYRVYGDYDFGNELEWEEKWKENGAEYIWMNEPGKHKEVHCHDTEWATVHFPVDDDMELDPQKINPEDKPWKRVIANEKLISMKPYFFGLEAYTVDESGLEERYEVTGQNFIGVPFEEKDMIGSVLYDAMIGEGLVEKVIFEEGLEKWVNLLKANVAYSANGKNLPAKIFLNAYIPLNLEVVTNDSIYYSNPNGEGLIEYNWDMKQIADNEWAENDMADDMTAVKKGKNKILWRGVDEDLLLGMADE